MKSTIIRYCLCLAPVLVFSLETRADIASPLDIAGHVLWLDASDLDGDGTPDLVEDGMLVDDWVDKSSGQGINTVTATGGAPVARLNAIGGRPGVYFAVGSEDKMDSETLVVAGDYTVFAVVQVDSTAGSGHVLSGLNTEGTDTVLYRNGTNLRFYSGWTTGNTDVVVSPLTDALRPFLFGYQINSAGEDFGFYQTTTTSFEANGSADLQGIRIGNLDRDTPSSPFRAEGLGGVIGEVIIYERALTTAEITDVVNYLDARYGLTTPTGGEPITSPLDISGHVLWLEGDDVDGDGVKDTGESGQPLTEWVDKSSGQGVNTVTLTNGAPTRQFDAFRGHHAVHFAGGSEDKLDNETLVVSDNYTVFTVIWPEDFAGSTHVLSGINDDATDTVLYRTATGAFRFYSGSITGGVDVQLGHWLGWRGPLLYGYQINAEGTDIGFFRDTPVLFEGNGPATLNGLRLGNLDRDTPSSTDRAEAFAGLIAEVIIYERSLSVDEIDRVHAYLTAKYDLDAPSLPPPGTTGTMTEIETGHVTGGSPSTLAEDSEPLASGRINVALAANGSTMFSQDFIGPNDPRDFRAWRANDGFYADPPEGAPPIDEPWIAATANSFLGVKLGEPATIDRIGLENQFANRRQGILTFEYTTDDFSEVTEDPDLGLWPEEVNALTWTIIDVKEMDDAENTRHLYSFPAIANVTGVRVRIQSTAAEVALTELEVWASPTVVPPTEDLRIVRFDRSGPTTFTIGWTSVAGGTYRLETSTTLAAEPPSWQEYQEGGSPKEIVATQAESETTLTLDPAVAPGRTFIRVKRMP